MGIHAVVGLNLRTGDALLSVKAGVLSATQDLFDEEIVPTAKELSPVTAEGYQRNVAEKKKHPSGTGTNRRSIDSTVTETAEGVQAQLFTQSGYGGYLRTRHFEDARAALPEPGFRDAHRQALGESEREAR